MGSNASSPAYSSATFNAGGAALAGRTYEALVAAATTLLQALERSGDADSRTPTKCNCPTAPTWRLPYLDIQDAPEFGCRGLMVDAARTAITALELQGFVDVCRFYKLNYLHVHMSDDQSL